jgi:plastocyanin
MLAPAHHCRTVALALVFFAVLLTGCGIRGTTTRPPAPVAVEPTAAVTVVIKNYAYIPANFTVPPGATVTVRNDDLAIHTLTADNGAFNTGNISRGVTTTFTAPMQRGIYPFHCMFHNYMEGSLTVS